MKEFQYFTPSTLEQACQILKEQEGAKVLAGGQSLIPVMKLGMSDISSIVDLKKIANLSYIRKESNEIAIGALTTHSEIAKSEIIRSDLPLLAETAGKIGHTQIRNRGTIGGSICHADPAADLPATTLALNATMVLQKDNSQRQVKADQFFKGVFETAVEKGELLKEIRFEIPRGSSSAFLKLTLPIGGFALVVVSCLLWLEGDNCTKASIAIGGVTETPFRATGSEEYLKGQRLDDNRITGAAAEKSLDGISIMQGLGYPQDYIERMVKVETKRAIRLALTRSRER